MADIKRADLFGKLHPLAYQAIESAAVFCKMRGNPYVELAHWIHQILQLPDSDLHHIARHFGLDPSRLAADLTQALDKLPRGSKTISDLSSSLEEATERGWVYTSLMFKGRQVRTGHLLAGMLKQRNLRHELIGISREFEKISADTLFDQWSQAVANSPEASDDGVEATGGGAAPGEASQAIAPAAMGKQEALRLYSVDLTERARRKQIDPIVGRDQEIRQVVDILMRRRQNNPILTGEAGVGKTAVVEGFAQRIAEGDVPPPLRDVTLRTLDIGLLQAGASMKGEFENRLRQVIEEVQSSPRPIILFVDEAHTLIGAGGAAGTGDAANLLKPALARGTLRTIAATTWAEYKKHIEKDPALTRRFQVVQVGEPTEDRAVQMMRGVASTLEQHHKVQVLDEALEASVKLSHRYIPSRQLPDKSVSLLDTACARVAISQHAVPAEVEDSRRRIQALETELEIIGREAAIGVDTGARDSAATTKLTAERERLAELEARWQAEKNLVAQILDLRRRLRAGGAKVDAPAAAVAAAVSAHTSAQASASAASADPRDSASATAVAEPEVEVPPATAEAAGGASASTAEGVAAPDDPATLRVRLAGLGTELAELQGDRPLILPTVDEQAVASVVQDWTGIPVGRMVRNEISAVLSLAEVLERRVVGQPHAMKALAKRIQTSRAGLDNPSKPVGVFMLVGPSGVGKTETALALAEALYGGEHNLITINMSEFQEPHTVSTLKGSPPGYVGYGEGGILTEAVRRKPYSVVLLDEIEKAHKDVHEIFFQVFDKGAMEDAEGRHIDFRNTLILLTTNAGSELIMSMCKDPELMPDADGLAQALRPTLLKEFPAALLGRLVVVPYLPLTDPMLEAITRLQLERVRRRVLENHGVPLQYDDEVVRLIVSRCTEVESGGRMVDAILTHNVLPALSREFLERMMRNEPIRDVRLHVAGGELAYAFA